MDLQGQMEDNLQREVQLEGSAAAPRQYITLPKVMCEPMIQTFQKKSMKSGYTVFMLLTILEGLKGLKFGNRREVCVPCD